MTPATGKDPETRVEAVSKRRANLPGVLFCLLIRPACFLKMTLVEGRALMHGSAEMRSRYRVLIRGVRYFGKLLWIDGRSNSG